MPGGIGITRYAMAAQRFGQGVCESPGDLSNTSDPIISAGHHGFSCSELGTRLLSPSEPQALYKHAGSSRKKPQAPLPVAFSRESLQGFSAARWRCERSLAGLLSSLPSGIFSIVSWIYPSYDKSNQSSRIIAMRSENYNNK